MKKSTKSFLFITTATLTAMYAYNRFVANTSTKKNTLPTKNGSYYSWKQGNIFYTKTGSGTPVLLIHDIHSASSSIEWSKISKRLQKTHTVYTVDLLGCGLSDKPAISYTIYLYVQLISAFIKDIIGERTDIIATNMAAPAVIMSDQMNDSIINKIILINPVSLKTLELAPTKQSKLKKNILNLPIIGTFIYNVLMNPKNMSRTIRNTYFSKTQLVSQTVEDAYFEAAHMDNSNGKYLYASMLGNYMGGSMQHAVKKIDKPIYMIVSRGISSTMKTVEEYRKLNTNFEVTSISDCKLYPQLERPEKVYNIIESILSKANR